MPDVAEPLLRGPVVPAGRSGAPNVLYLSLVHPDFLPSVYSVAQVLSAEGYSVRIVSFDSPAPGRYAPGLRIQMSACGPYRGSFLQRAQARARFGETVRSLVASERPTAVITACPFSYLEALRFVPATTPIIYQAFETYPASIKELRQSPLTTLRNWRARRRLGRAAMICTPSPERSGWLMAYAGLHALPETVLNVPSWRETLLEDETTAPAPVALPDTIAGKRLVINTGNVNPTQATLELVESVADWPEDACLVVTNVGDTSYSGAIRQLREQSPRRADIIVLPMVSRAGMRWLQRRATIGTCLTRTTPSLEAIMPAPNKVGEYLHSGLVLVGNRTPYLERLAAHGVVEFADTLEPRAIARAVGDAVVMVRRGDTRERARALAQSWYCMEVQALPILTLVRAVSSFTPPPSATDSSQPSADVLSGTYGAVKDEPPIGVSSRGLSGPP